MSSKSSGLSHNEPNVITISILGLSGTEDVKGSIGVGKSLMCNRFVRGGYDGFCTEHSSVLSQSDFGGSPVINSDHWLYWGEALINNDESHNSVRVRVIEQTEFIDDENFESFDGFEVYSKRATKVKLESADKLMYICREQLGLEAEFEQRILPESRVTVDGFIFIYDISFVEDRSFDRQSDFALNILINALKTKRPIVVAASKADVADENGRKALQKLMSRKELRSANLQIVEVSSIANINIVNVFAVTAALVEKWKTRPRILSYIDAAKVQGRKEHEICDSYVILLRKLMPIDCWPNSRPTWNKLLTRFGLAMHMEFKNFVYVFGAKKAKEYYKIHVEEAKSFWIQRRLQSQILRLPKVFEMFIGVGEITSVTWPEAKKIIFDHPLFDKYFSPIGTFDADLDPTSPKIELNPNESRIPAEALLAAEAVSVFDEIQRVQKQRHQRAHMEEQFEITLTECPQVTPGKPLEEVAIFLRGKPGYDSVPLQLAQTIYSKYQEQLIEKAEADFQNLLLEQVQLFIDFIIKKRIKQRSIKYERQFNELKSLLTDDVRYRQLNCLFEERDKMLANFASFVAHPSVQNCLAGPKCIESTLHENFHSYLESRQMSDSTGIFDMHIVTFGEKHLVAGFQTGAEKVLCGDVFESERGLARIYFVNEDDSGFDITMFATWIFFVDSMEACEQLRRRSFEILDTRCPPLIVLVADAVHFDMLPAVFKEACALAKECGSIFVGPGSDPLSEYNHASENELNALFTRDQMFRILDAVFASQISPRRLDSRVRISTLCGDEIPLENLLESILAHALRFVPYACGGAAVVDLNLPTLEQCARIEISFSSYHSWFFTRTPPFHGNIMVYCAHRRASFAHMEVVLRNFVLLPRNAAVLIVAVVDAACQEMREEASELLSKGRDLAMNLSAAFVVLSANNLDDIKADEFIEFFEKTIHIDLGNELISVCTGSSQLYQLYSNAMNYSKSPGAPYDYTLESRWSDGSRESTSSSRKSPMIFSDPSFSSNITSGPSDIPLLHGQEGDFVSNNIVDTFNKQNLSLVEHGENMKGIHGLHLSLSPSGRALLNDGLAPLATPEATDSFADTGPVRIASPNSRLDINLSKFISAYSSNNCSTTPIKHHSKGYHGHHTHNIFIGGNVEPALPINRLKNRLHSISAESLVTTGLVGSSIFYDHSNDSEASSSADATKKSTTSRFVRKVASSFRFRKNGLPNLTKKMCDIGYDADLLTTTIPVNESCSAPHSPHNDRSLRSSPKSKEVSPSNEKNLNPFSWFPSRAPRRTTTKIASEAICRTGVIMPSDTLESLAANTKDQVPLFVKMCIEYIEGEGGLEIEGVYRIPGNQAQVGELELAFISDSATAFILTRPPVNAVATALKNFFANLPEPLVPYEMYEQLLFCLDCDQKEALIQVGNKLKEWPVANRKTFLYLGAHLARVAHHADANAMDVRNLAKVWWPTLFRPNFDSFESMAVFVTRLELAAQLLITYAIEQQR